MHTTLSILYKSRQRAATGLVSVLCLLLTMQGSFAAANDERAGLITATRLNVRARAGTTYEVVCQLLKGAEVTVVAEDGEWIGIRAPRSTVAWIALRTLTGDRINAANTPVYAGPGTIYSQYDVLDKGETVRVIRVEDGQWAQIEAPADAVVWVHQNYINVEMPPVPEVVLVDPDQDVPEEAVAVVEPSVTPDEGFTETDVVPQDGSVVEAVDPVESVAQELPPKLVPPTIHSMVGLPEDRKSLTRIGVPRPYKETATVIALGPDQRPFAYALAVEIDQVYYPLAYLSEKGMNLQAWLGQRVTIVGEKQWIQHWPQPLITIDRVEPAKNDPLGG